MSLRKGIDTFIEMQKRSKDAVKEAKEPESQAAEPRILLDDQKPNLSDREKQVEEIRRDFEEAGKILKEASDQFMINLRKMKFDDALKIFQETVDEIAAKHMDEDEGAESTCPNEI